jgi:hypothetical protein
MQMAGEPRRCRPPLGEGCAGNGLGGHRVTAVEESRNSVLDASG